MPGESFAATGPWRARLDGHCRWLRRWLTEVHGVDEPEALLWPVRTPAAERAVARVVERKPLGQTELADVRQWFLEARLQIMKVLAARRVPAQEHEDLSQEVLARALARLGTFKPDGDDISDSLRRWILGFARNVVRERHRSWHVQEVPTEFIDEGPSRDLGPDVLADLERRAPGLLDRLEALSDERRAAWLAIDFEGAKPRAFAAATHTPDETVYTNLKVARAKLVEPPPSRRTP